MFKQLVVKYLAYKCFVADHNFKLRENYEFPEIYEFWEYSQQYSQGIIPVAYIPGNFTPLLSWCSDIW